MMLLLNAVRLAVGTILRNKTRAALTVLGILIGVAAVVTVTALASGASARVGGEIDSFAADALYIHPQTTQRSGARGKVTGRLTENDAHAIARDAVSISRVGVFSGATGQIVYGDKNVFTQINASDLPYFPIRKWKIDKGEFWTEMDELLKTKVCVLGATVREKLFGTEDPIGHTVRIGRSPYRVIGVFQARGSGLFGDDQDDRIMMPIGSYRARVAPSSPGRVDQIMAESSSSETTKRARQQITEILRQRHHIIQGADSDFVIDSQDEFKKSQEAIASVLSALLMSVAGISLLVGGIGVMNIMLVSVAERTREIGIRMSIGAREGDILVQFLVEAVVLSMIGGVLGIGLGTFATGGLARALDWPMKPSLAALAIAVATSAGIGVVFGFVPARTAAKMDPIDALRTE
jgi:putative ABC transport system permease protein